MFDKPRTHSLRNVDMLRKSPHGQLYFDATVEAASIAAAFCAVYLICPLAMAPYAVSTMFFWTDDFWFWEDSNAYKAKWLLAEPVDS